MLLQIQVPPGVSVHIIIETWEDLAYDDDPARNALIANSLDELQRLDEKARQGNEQRPTLSLDPNC